MNTKQKTETAKNVKNITNTKVKGLVDQSTFKEVKPVDSKKEVKVTLINKEGQLKELLSKVEKLENLRKYYGKLKAKRNTLETALKKMHQYNTIKDDQFEENSLEKFPFEIILKGLGEYERKEELFTISKHETVTNFTDFLLRQINELLEVFESDLIDEAQNGF